MPLRDKEARSRANGPSLEEKLDELNPSNAADKPRQVRSARLQRLIAHLHKAGPRPVMEAMLQVAGGEPLDSVLEAYGRIPVEIYHQFGANSLPYERLRVV
jgi:hypothetical protein